MNQRRWWVRHLLQLKSCTSSSDDTSSLWGPLWVPFSSPEFRLWKLFGMNFGWGCVYFFLFEAKTSREFTRPHEGNGRRAAFKFLFLLRCVAESSYFRMMFVSRINAQIKKSLEVCSPHRLLLPLLFVQPLAKTSLTCPDAEGRSK